MPAIERGHRDARIK